MPSIYEARPDEEMTPEQVAEVLLEEEAGSHRDPLREQRLACPALSKHVHHDAAREWLETVDESASVFFCRPTQQAFLRLLTNASVLGPYGNPPLTNREAWSAYEAFLSDNRIAVQRNEPVGVESLWKALAVRGTRSLPEYR